MNPNLKSAFKKVFLVACLAALLPLPSGADPAFEDASAAAGIDTSIQTAALAWGDVNKDGWPDVWVSNHDMKPPSLYLNRRNGTFVEASNTQLAGKVIGDFHGAAWADFDNDGDQDLVITTGGGAGRGRCPNLLLVNENGVLSEQAETYSVDYPLGRGRTPLWLDADKDGRLDLLFMNQVRPDGEAPSALFIQDGNRFVASNRKFGFNPLGTRSRKEQAVDILENLSKLRIRKGPGKIVPADAFALLGDLQGDHIADLVSGVKPLRIYSIASVPFDDVTNDIELPDIVGVQDMVIDDFNGDGLMDIFLARAFLTSDLVQPDSRSLQGIVKGGTDKEPKEFRFTSKGSVTFQFYSPWADPTDPEGAPPPVFYGRNGRSPADGRAITLAAADVAAVPETTQTPDGRYVAIEFTAPTGEWIVRIAHPAAISFTADAQNTLDNPRGIGFEPSKGALDDTLLINKGNRFVAQPDAAVSQQPTPSRSVVSGDFDNDMDLDLYVVCAEPTRNVPNLLYVNDGAGRFRTVPDAGGAAGSSGGRGNRVAAGDYDQDGFLDLFVINGAGDPPFSTGPHQLFRNKGNSNHWLELDLIGSVSNRDAVGAVVVIESGGVKQIQCQDNGIHSFAQNHQRIHFGLGKNPTVDAIKIYWPSGIIQESKDIPADRILTMEEPSPK